MGQPKMLSDEKKLHRISFSMLEYSTSICVIDILWKI